MQKPNNIEPYDCIIVGCGSSGLSLAWYLIQELGETYKILLIERSFENRKNKTWCFWDEDAKPDIISSRIFWNDLVFGNQKEKITGSLINYTYRMISSASYEEMMIKELCKYKNIFWAEDTVKSIQEDDSYTTVIAENGIYNAKKVFKSNIRQKDITNSVYLKQHFLGWKVKTDNAVFDHKKAVLMDFNVAQKNATAFMYLLPFSGSTALVEYTMFSKNVLEKDEYEYEINKYLYDNFGLTADDYKVTETEGGAIPMIMRGSKLKEGKNIFNIGVAAGSNKPTTGYAFNRIHRINMQIAKHISKGEEPQVLNLSPKRYRFYDILLLDILENQPDASVNIFSKLFKRNSMDSILKFMDEKAGFLENMRLLVTLPWGPFLKALWRNRKHILTGKF